MEQKSFIVFVTAGGKPVTNPYVCMCDTSEEAQDLVTTDLASKFTSIPMGTMLHIFDTDSEVTYLGEPKKHEEEPEDETAEDETNRCSCPNGDKCRYSTAPGACGYGRGVDDTGGKLCADSAEAPDLNYPEEGRVYGPEELLFAIGPYDHIDLIPDMKFVVYLTLADGFEKTGYQTDDLGGHNVDNAALRAAGLCEAELMESVFEVNPKEGDTREALASRLIDAGFGYRQAFQDFMDRCGETETGA